MSSFGDKVSSFAAGLQEYTDPVMNLAADAYDSITNSGFKPIKKANDADVKKLIEALKKSATSTEMLAKLTDQKTKITEPAMGNRDAIGSGGSRGIILAARNDKTSQAQPITRVEHIQPQAPLNKAEGSAPQPPVQPVERGAPQPQRVEPNALQATIDRGLQESVLDLTAKLRNAASARNEKEQAKDDSYLSHVLPGGKIGGGGDDTISGEQERAVPSLDNKDWKLALKPLRGTDNTPSLPAVDVVGGDTTLKGSQDILDSSTTESPAAGDKQPRQQADGSIIYGDERSSIKRTAAGDTVMTGPTEVLKVIGGDLKAFNQKGRLFLERKQGEKTRAHVGGDLLLERAAGWLEVFNQAGELKEKIGPDQIQTNVLKLQTVQYLDEQDFGKAMERWRKDGGKLEKGKTSLYMRYKTGFALVEPTTDQYTVVMFKENNKFEVHRKLADGVTLIKDADDRFFVGTSESRFELSAEQQEEVLKQLPEEQQKNIRSIQSNLSKGVIDVPEGKLVLKDGNAEFTASIASVGGMAGALATNLKFNINAHTDELVENREDGTKSKLSLDLHNRTFAQEETDAKGEVIKTEVDLANDLKAKGEDWELVGNVFTTKDKYRVDEHGNVTTPDGSVVRNNGDIHYSNGMTLLNDGTLKNSDGKVVTAIGVPTEKQVDALVSNGLSIARSLSSGGPATFAQIALLEANLSIVSNLIGLFSNIGNLQEATKLFKVWGTMNESLCKARVEVNEKNTRTSNNQVSQFSRNSTASGGWISCNLKAAA